MHYPGIFQQWTGEDHLRLLKIVGLDVYIFEPGTSHVLTTRSRLSRLALKVL
jgi:hypothetical protein